VGNSDGRQWGELHGRRPHLTSPSAERSQRAEYQLSRRAFGASLPRSEAPLGATLIARRKIDNWTVARFVLDRPERLSIDSLASIAPRFFRRTPSALLIFIQRPALTPEVRGSGRSELLPAHMRTSTTLTGR
jgi:hypothetical protein